MSNDVVVKIGDRRGRILGEIVCDVGEVSWRLNGVGKGSLGVAGGSDFAREDYLRFGNTVLFEFGNGLPAWGGVIDTPRDWQGGVIGVSLYSGEYLLGWRQTDRGRYFDDASVGYIFERLILEAKEIWPMEVDVGQVWYGGDGHWPEYHFDNLLETIQKSVCGRLSGADFEVTAREEDGYIKFTANLYERKGVDRPGVVLVEDVNVDRLRLLEQGPIINWWDLAGEGSGWGLDRVYSQRYDRDSISVYGLRQGAKILSSVNEQGTLDGAADLLLAESVGPANRWDVDVLDVGSGRFGDYGVGDSVRLVAPSYGFGGRDVMVKVEGRSFEAMGGRCRLIVEEV